MIKIFSGLLASSLAVIAFLWWRLDAVAEERAEYKASAAANEATIQRFMASSLLTEDVLAEVRAMRRDIRAQDASTRRAIQELEATNEEVRDYLNQPVPPDLADLLWPDHEKPGAAAGAPE